MDRFLRSLLCKIMQRLAPTRRDFLRLAIAATGSLVFAACQSDHVSLTGAGQHPDCTVSTLNKWRAHSDLRALLRYLDPELGEAAGWQVQTADAHADNPYVDEAQKTVFVGSFSGPRLELEVFKALLAHLDLKKFSALRGQGDWLQEWGINWYVVQETFPFLAPKEAQQRFFETYKQLLAAHRKRWATRVMATVFGLSEEEQRQAGVDPLNPIFVEAFEELPYSVAFSLLLDKAPVERLVRETIESSDLALPYLPGSPQYAISLLFAFSDPAQPLSAEDLAVLPALDDLIPLHYWMDPLSDYFWKRKGREIALSRLGQRTLGVYDGTLYVFVNGERYARRTDREYVQLQAETKVPFSYLMPDQVANRGRVLVSSCGGGSYVKELVAAGASAMGVDMLVDDAQKQLNATRLAEGKQPLFYEANMIATGLSAESMDYVIDLFGGFHYGKSQPPFLYDALLSLQYVLAPGGQAVLGGLPALPAPSNILDALLALTDLKIIDSGVFGPLESNSNQR